MLGHLGSLAKSSVRNSGITFDSGFTLDAHVKFLVHHLRSTAKLSSVVSRAELEMIIHAFVSS